MLKLAMVLALLVVVVTVIVFFVARFAYVELTRDTVHCLCYQAADLLRRKDVKVLTQAEVEELAAGLGTASVSHVWKDAKGMTVDPWGNQFRVQCKQTPAGMVIAAISLGPDHALDTTDDITYSEMVPK